MFCLWLTQRKAKTYLSEPILNRDLHSQEKDLLLSKAALIETLCRAKEIFPKARFVHIGRNNYPLHDNNNRYLLLLISTNQAIQENRWNDACNNLLDVIQSFRVEDRRILNEVIHLLENGLK